jgi:hypothetical protein
LRLIRILPKNPRQLGLTPTVYDFGSRERLPQIHPHIERAILLKTEPASCFIQLRRTHAQIQQHPVATRARNPFREFGKIRLPDLKTPGKPASFSRRLALQPLRHRDRIHTTIHSDCSPPIWLPRVQPTDRAVGVTSGRRWSERRQHFCQQDRL